MRSLATLLVLAATSTALAQNPPVQQAGSAVGGREFQLEFSGGIGFTSVDHEKWGGALATNEELMLSLFDARLFFASARGFKFGVEGGYRYFMYYEYPTGTGGYYYYDVDATRIGAVARRPLNAHVSFDVGAAAYMFGDFTDVGLSGALVFNFPVGGKVSLPLHLRTDLVFDDQLIVGSGATLGLALKW
jgi:hypothetical protein